MKGFVMIIIFYDCVTASKKSNNVDKHNKTQIIVLV